MTTTHTARVLLLLLLSNSNISSSRARFAPATLPVDFCSSRGGRWPLWPPLIAQQSPPQYYRVNVFPQIRPEEKKTTSSHYRTTTMGNEPQQVAVAAARIEVVLGSGDMVLLETDRIMGNCVCEPLRTRRVDYVSSCRV
ncbi:hypothetical protein ACI65C_000029 [Semiaphis heraclei]